MEEGEKLGNEILNKEENKDLTKHERKMLRKGQKHEEMQEHHGAKSKEKLNKKIVKYSVVASILILIVLGGYFLIIKPIKGFQPIHTGAYHWHANLEISVCGQPAQLRCATGLCGPMSMHHHNDDIIHLEGNTIAKDEDITLGRFFDGLNLEFSETNLLGNANGDLCPSGQPGTVKMYVDGAENNEFRNYILNSCDSANIKQDCEKIELKFE